MLGLSDVGAICCKTIASVKLEWEKIKTIFVFTIIICLAVFLYFGVPWIYGRWARISIGRKAKKGKVLVLTFDDGPGSRLTPAILKILAENDARATFFLLGRNIVGREEIVRRIVESGHEICSHGYNHLHSWKVSPIRAISDIKRGWETIDKALGKTDSVYPFRPPYGKLNLFCLLYLRVHKIPIFYWTLVSGDTWPLDKRDSKRAALLAGKTGGAVVLAHDFDRTSNHVDNMVLESVRLALAMAKEKNMQILTCSQLLSRCK